MEQASTLTKRKYINTVDMLHVLGLDSLSYKHTRIEKQQPSDISRNGKYETCICINRRVEFFVIRLCAKLIKNAVQIVRCLLRLGKNLLDVCHIHFRFLPFMEVYKCLSECLRLNISIEEDTSS